MTSMNILASLKSDGEKAVKEGRFPGVTTFGGLVEHALNHILYVEDAEVETPEVHVE